MTNPSASPTPPHTLYAWHFSTGLLRFEYENTPVEAGLSLKTDEPPVPESSGFHACISPMDALRYFAVRPNDRIIISRVRLSGKMIEDETHSGKRLVAQQREHLWTADAEAILEDFARSYVFQVLDWLRAENIVIPDNIIQAMQSRQRWFLKEISQRELYAAADALLAWGDEQNQPQNHPKNILTIAELNKMIETLLEASSSTQDWGEYSQAISDVNFEFEKAISAFFQEAPTSWQDSLQRWQSVNAIQNKLEALKTLFLQSHAAHFWLHHWRAKMEAEPVALARRLAGSIRRDTQFFALETPRMAAECYQVMCNYYGWLALTADDTVPVSRIRVEYAGVAWKYSLEAPEPYLSACKLPKLESDVDLHMRLMQLAPDGYQE